MPTQDGQPFRDLNGNGMDPYEDPRLTPRGRARRISSDGFAGGEGRSAVPDRNRDRAGRSLLEGPGVISKSPT